MERFTKSPLVNYILYICNAVFAIFGFVLAIVGIVMIKKIGDFTQFPHAFYIKTLPTLVIVLGFFVVIIAIFGSFGVYVESRPIIYIYTVAVVLLFISQLAMISWVFVHISSHPSAMADLVSMAWSQNYPEYGFPMDIFQIQFDCCGRYDSSDYTSKGDKVPNSCCGEWILYECPDKIYLTKPGCIHEFYDFWESNNDIIRFVGIVIAAAQLLALVFTFFFIKTLNSSSTSY